MLMYTMDFFKKAARSPILIPFAGDMSMEITWTNQEHIQPPPNEFLDTWLNS